MSTKILLGSILLVRFALGENAVIECVAGEVRKPETVTSERGRELKARIAVMRGERVFCLGNAGRVRCEVPPGRYAITAYDTMGYLSPYRRAEVDARAGDHLRFFLRVLPSEADMENRKKLWGVQPPQYARLGAGDDPVLVRYSEVSATAQHQTFGGYYFELTYQSITIAGHQVTCTESGSVCEGPAGTIVEFARTGEILSGRRVVIDFTKKEVRIEDSGWIVRRF